MNMHLLAAIVALLGMTFGGCALREETVQLADVAYLTFVGDPSELQFRIDEGNRVAMRGSDEEVRYEVAPGRHRVRVWRGDELIVDRLVFLSQGQSFRVVLP